MKEELLGFSDNMKICESAARTSGNRGVKKLQIHRFVRVSTKKDVSVRFFCNQPFWNKRHADKPPYCGL